MAIFMAASMAWATWTTTINPHATAKGYAKSGGLPTAFVTTVDVSASVVGDFIPYEGVGDCAAARAQCGDLSVRFSSSSPFAIHLSSVTFGGGPFPAGDPLGCAVGIFAADRTQAVDVTIPASGQSGTVVLDGLLYMNPVAPEACAGQVFEAPITALSGTRV
jgi:hypothetical protein